MKSILEILGGAQILLGLSFDLQECFEEYLTEEYRGFLTLLRVVEEQVRGLEGYRGGRGRPGYGRQSFLRAFLALRCVRIDTVKALRVRLGGDVNLRRICGFRRVPDAATFSRRLKEFAGRGVGSSSERAGAAVSRGRVGRTYVSRFHGHRGTGAASEPEAGGSSPAEARWVQTLKRRN